MTTFKTFGDLEAIAGYVMRAAAVTGVSTRVYTSIPKTPTFPVATYNRIGGTPPVKQALDMANIQVDVWGDDTTSKSTLRDAAEALRRALLAMEGTTYTTGSGAPVNAVISNVEDSMGLAWLPDPQTGRGRYVFGMNVHGR